jgi:hypothetical protein
VRYAGIQHKIRFFSNVTTVLPLSGVVGDHLGGFPGSNEISRDRARPEDHAIGGTAE